MSNNSDSDEFYDAEEDISNQANKSKKSRTLSRDLTQRANSEPNVFQKCESIRKEVGKLYSNDEDEISGVPSDSLGSNRKKFKELRQKLQNDDDDPQTGEVSQADSQTSSVEGVSVGSTKITHPFRVIEQDTVSLQSHSSLGRLGRILGNTSDSGTIPENGRKAVSVSALSSSSLDSGSTPSSKGMSQYPSISTLTSIKPAQNIEITTKLQEPDVIASTKTSTATSSSLIKAPIAPPRRKKKNKDVGSLNLTKSASTTTFQTTSHHLASPVSTVESLTREFEHSLPKQSSLTSTKSETEQDPEPKSLKNSKTSTLKSIHSLDINQALKGKFVVKPQDNDNYKAKKSSKIDVAEKSSCISLAGDSSNIVVTSTRGSSSRSSVGHYSLGPHRGINKPSTSNSKERRKSAGDENMMAMKVRTHTDSGKQLSDLEILEQVTVLNLDTGERVPLSVAEDKLPQCINPLSLHIMRLTSEYVSSSSMDKIKESDEESVDLKKSEIPVVDAENAEGGRVRRKTAKLKRFLDSTVRKTMHKAKSIAQEVSHARHKEDTIDIIDNVHPGEQNIKLKTSNSHKGPYEFEKVEHVQEINDEHEGPIWCMKFSCCGKLLATAGQDKVLRIWIVRDSFQFFQEMRTKYNAEKVSPTPSQESLVSHHSNEASTSLPNMETMNNKENSKLVFMPKPFCTYSGHTSDLLDVSWSKNYFILSSSMDKTVRLWHISRKECLCCFQHIDFVTAIVFHPRDDRYFLSGSLDGKLRLWNIPDKKVAVWNEVEGTTKLITAANFCQNGMFAVVGTYDGRCIFYNTDQLKYHTQIHVRSSRGRNAVGRKISGIEPMPGQDKILITSNDSRIRLYDLIDLNVSCKYKGYVNMSSQIKASFSHDGKYVVSGSENRDVYIWKTSHDYAKFSSVRRDRNDFWEAIKAHNNTVTCAIFAPNPESIIKMVEEASRSETVEDEDNKVEDPIVEQHTKGCGGYVLVSADFNGCIKVFINKMKPKHSSLPVSAMS